MAKGESAVSTVMSAIGEATGMKPDDRVIALGALAAAKMKTMAYCGALLECASPDLRHLLTTHMNDTLAEHERCTQLAIERDWYKAYAGATELVKQAIQDAQPVLGG